MNKETHVLTFSCQGQDFDILINNGKISYLFEYKGERYGNAVKIDRRSTESIIKASFNLFINYLETYAAVLKK